MVSDGMRNPDDKVIFCESVEEHMQQSITSIKNWLTTCKPLINQSISLAEQAETAATRALTTYFHRIQRRKRTRRKKRVPSTNKRHKHTQIRDYCTQVLETCTQSDIQSRHKRCTQKSPHLHTDHPISARGSMIILI